MKMRYRFLLAALVALIFAASALAADGRTPTQDGIVYGVADGQQLTMDYYAPKGPGPHPIAIIIHGGGYQRGTSKSGEAYCADFLSPAGYAVFSINYRLAPKYPYPYMVYDVERAIRFLRHKASRSPDLQANRIALIGGSAGGFLSNMVGLLNLPGDLSAADPVGREGGAGAGG